MAISCPACGRSVKGRGLHNHLRQSTDPRCHELWSRTILEDLSDDGKSETSRVSLDVDDLDADEHLPAFSPDDDPTTAPHVNNKHPAVDLRGDFFGNYADYLQVDPASGMSIDEYDQEGQSDVAAGDVEIEGEDMDAGDVEIEGKDMNDEEVMNAKEEGGLEPEHVAQSVDVGLVMEDDLIDENAHHAFQLCGGAEEPLHKEPVTEKFHGQAGEVVSRGHSGQDEAYMQTIGEVDNLFAPFLLKMEWEIARWAKLHGPSSTAFTELVKIEGVG